MAYGFCNAAFIDPTCILSFIMHGLERPGIVQRQNPESGRSSKFTVFIPGLTGGGIYNTVLRERLHDAFGNNVLVPSSISTPEGMKSESMGAGYYERLAKDVLGKSGGSQLILVGHSLGSLEMLDLARELINQQKHLQQKQAIDLVIASGLGFGKDMRALAEIGRRVERMGSLVDEYEQHSAFPLPGDFYAGRRIENMPAGAITVYTDSAQQIEERRVRFINEWLPAIIPDDTQRKSVIGRLDEIDTQILAGQNLEANWKERMALLHDPIQALFHGKHIDNETHTRFLAQYGESADLLTGGLAKYVAAGIHLARMGGKILMGPDQQLKDLIRKAAESGIPLRTHLFIMERDVVGKSEDLPGIQRDITADEMGSILFAETYAHSTIGYDPKALIQAIQHLSNSV